jgi:undecaprenyl-diphosphatase
VIARLLSLDELLFQRIGAFRPRVLVRVMRGLTHLGNAESWFVIGLFLLACGGRAAQYGSLLGAGAVLATLTSQTLKRACCRPRPSSQLPGFVALIDNPDVFSFPSGHAAVAFAVAVALAGHGAGLGPLAFALATAIGLSRIYLGAHYPLDVGVGALLGCACGTLARFLVAI